MAAEQRESGLGRAPVRLAGGRSPARESSAAVALVTATGLGKLRPGPAGLRRAARSSGFPQARVLGSRPRPRVRLTRSRARCSPHNPAWGSVAASTALPECERPNAGPFRQVTCPKDTGVPPGGPRSPEPCDTQRAARPTVDCYSFPGTRQMGVGGRLPA